MGDNQLGLSWKPKSFTLDSIGDQKFVRVTDGDTPVIEMPIRMLSVDTPEVTAKSPEGAAKRDAEFALLAEWIKQGKAPVTGRFGDYIAPKLETGKAGSLQFTAGKAASKWLTDEMARRLAKENGGQRRLFVRVSERPFDDNGRLLAYVSPYYEKQELEGLSVEQRVTFNLGLVRTGMAAPFIIYPSIPGDKDLALVTEAARTAVDSKLGQWAEEKMLPGYEYRMCEKLFRITKKLVDGEQMNAADRLKWRSRYCVDMRDRTLYGPEDYMDIPHAFRLWLWPNDVEEASAALDLLAGPGSAGG